MKRSKLKPVYQQGGFSPVQLSNSEFIPTYRGAPLEEAKSNAAAIATQYHKNIADLTQLDIMNANRKLLDQDKEDSAQYDAYLKSQMEELAKRGDYENMTMRVNALAREFVNNKDLKLFAENKAARDKEDEENRKMILAGKTPVLVQDINKFKSVTWDDKGNKVYHTYKPTSEADLVARTMRKDIWDEVVAGMKPMTAVQAKQYMQDFTGYLRTGEWSGITPKIISDRLEDALNTYSDTPHKKQEVKITAKALMDADPNLTEAEATTKAEAASRAKMTSEGMLRIYDKFDPNYLADRTFKLDDGSGATPTEPAVVTSPVPASVTEGEDLDWLLDTDAEGNNKGQSSLVGFLGTIGEAFNLTSKGLHGSGTGFNKDNIKGGFDDPVLQAKFNEEKEAAMERARAKDLTSEQATAIKVEILKNAMDIYGVTGTRSKGLATPQTVNSSQMSPEELKKFSTTPGGKLALNNYLQDYTKYRTSAPMVVTPLEEDVRQVQEDFARSNFNWRSVVDITDRNNPTYYGQIATQGKVHPDLKGLTQAFIDKKAIYQGTHLPEHVFTTAQNAGENFVRGMEFTVPTGDGNYKTYLVSQLPGKTQQPDINQNKMFLAASTRLGQWNSVDEHVKVLKLASEAQRREWYAKPEIQKYNNQLSWDTFNKEGTVLVNIDGDVVPYPSMAKAAVELNKLGYNFNFAK